MPKASRTKQPNGLVLFGHFTSLPTGKAALMLSMAKLRFEYRQVELFERQQFGAGFTKLNVAQQVPVLCHGKTTVTQSAVILQYLSELSGKFGGRSSAERRQILQWLFFDADMIASLRFPRTLTRIFNANQEQVCEFHRERGRRALASINEVLKKQDFIALRRPSIADIAMFPVVDNASEAGVATTKYTHVRRWLERMRRLPGCENHYELMARHTIVDMSTTPAASGVSR